MAMIEVADLFIALSTNMQTTEGVAENEKAIGALHGQLHEALWRRFKKPSKATLTRIRNLFFERDNASQALWEYWAAVMNVDALYQCGVKDYAMGFDGKLEGGLGQWAPLFRRELLHAQRKMAEDEESSDGGLANGAAERKEVNLPTYRRPATAPMQCPTWNGERSTCAKWSVM